MLRYQQWLSLNGTLPSSLSAFGKPRKRLMMRFFCVEMIYYFLLNSFHIVLIDGLV